MVVAIGCLAGLAVTGTDTTGWATTAFHVAVDDCSRVA
jgi:hypothetical protein